MGWSAACGLGLAQDVLHLDDQEGVDQQGEHEQDESDDGDGSDPAADGAEIFDELLLLQGVAVGGFADVVELIFKTLDSGGLFGDLGTELTVGSANFDEAALDWFQIDLNWNRGWRRRWVMDVLHRRLLGGYQRGDRRGCRGDVAFE